MVAKRTYMHVHKPLYCIINQPLYLNYSTSSTQIFSKPNHKISKFIVYCNSQITQNGRTGNIKEAESIFRRMPAKNIISWTAMLTAYAGNGQIKEARKLFDEMPERNVASWNAMITALVRNRVRTDDAFQLFTRMPQRNAVSYAVMLTGLVEAGWLDKADELYSNVPVSWRDPICSNALVSGYLKIGNFDKAVTVFEGMVEKDVISWSSMVDGYCKKGRLSEARELFGRMPERNVITWTAMINGYMKMECFKDGFELFLQMRREDSVKLVPNTLTLIFDVCGRLGRYKEACQFHALVFRVGFDFDVFLGNSVITMYCRLGCTDAASTIFHIMEKKDVVSWNSLVFGYVQAGQVEEAYELFKEVPEKDVVSWTTMITGFSNQGLTGKSIELFKMMPEKDDVAWTALISGFVSNGEYEEALFWFILMLEKAVRPNPVTFSSVLSSAAGLATLNQGLQIHAHVLKLCMEFDLSVQNSLVSMYSKCGSVNDAYRIFKSISTPNLVSYNSMITGFAQNGFGKEAILLFKKMQDEVLEVNEVTFLGVLSACTHVGLVEEGWNYFKSMRLTYKIEPGPDHYACMVDLLGRAGLLDQAINLISSMPIEPHSGVWGALLAASRTHLRLDLAEVASQHLSELEPNNATPYVVLSDLYSVSGKKKDEEQLRIAMKSKGIKKSPGCSWITVKSKVNLFLSGDISHVSFEDIRSILWIIVDEMKQD